MNSEKIAEQPKVVAVCDTCGLKYIWVNEKNPQPKCVIHHCDGRIVKLDSLHSERTRS